jgi:methyl-accepting chemotaxis protein
MDISIRQRLVIAFVVVVAVNLISVALGLFFARNESIVQNSLLNQRQPAVLSSLRLSANVQQSLAALRGYMLLGSDINTGKTMLEQQSKAWDQIDAEVAILSVLAKTWQNPNDRVLLNDAVSNLESLRKFQQEIIDLSHKIENIPAETIFRQQVEPLTTSIFELATAMIELELNLEPTAERKKILKSMADFRGAFTSSFADIRAYLATGESRYFDSFNKKSKVYDEAFNKLQDAESKLSKDQLQNLSILKNDLAKINLIAPQVISLRKSADWNRANSILRNQAAPLVKEIVSILESFQSSEAKQMADAQTELTQMTSKLTISLIVGLFVSFTTSLTIAFKISGSISYRLGKLVNQANHIASGDLTRSSLNTKSNDEIGELSNSLDKMQQNLKSIIEQITSSSVNLASASTQLSNASQLSLLQMQEQRNETHTVATAMEEMAATVKDVAKNAEFAALSASKADSSSDAGQIIVKETVTKVNDLAKSINNATSTVNSLGEDTSSVDKIVAVISAIAEQTNLLALNAAIEAARAGEQGRGFAVVADEVRTLAARTQQSTVEIRSMLDKLKNGAAHAVNGMSQGHELANQGVESCDKTLTALKLIADAVGEIRAMNDQIATAAEQQSVVADEMSRSVVTISNGAELMVVQTQQSLEAAQNMQGLATGLQRLTERFKL